MSSVVHDDFAADASGTEFGIPGPPESRPFDTARSRGKARRPTTRVKRGAEEKTKSVTKTQSWPARATTEHIELVAQGGVLDHEFAARTAAQVGHDLDGLNTLRQWQRAQTLAGASLIGGHTLLGR